MKKRILIANRGLIAEKIIRACNELNIETVVIYSVSDKNENFVKKSSYAVCIGSDLLNDSYLNQERIIEVAKQYRCIAIHPGIGFLSENADFAEKVRKEKLIFIGPSTSSMSLMANKIKARLFVESLGIPIIPGSNGSVKTLYEALEISQIIGYPIILKSADGGGGRGIRIVRNDEELKCFYETVNNEVKNGFGTCDIFIEKYINNAKHVEIQIAGDLFGNLIHIYGRDCSVQRNHQKIIEFAPMVKDYLDNRIINDAIKIANKINYDSLGTIEFLVENDNDKYYFIEMNTRLQVEHSITDKISSIDLIKLQISNSFGEKLNLNQNEIVCDGYAMECRICAEDITNHFMPSVGTIEKLYFPEKEDIIIESDLRVGKYISPYYDSMIAKIIIHKQSIDECINGLIDFLNQAEIIGVKTNIDLIKIILEDKIFREGKYLSSTLEKNYDNYVEYFMKKRCPSCGKFTSTSVLRNNLNVCTCGYHFYMSAKDRIQLLCDKDSFIEYPFDFDGSFYKDNPEYLHKLEKLRIQTGLLDAVITGEGQVSGSRVSIIIMDKIFMMGSMGFIVGEKITQCIEKAIKNNNPLIIFTASGGARMQENIISLVQMSKICSVLKEYENTKQLFISCLTNPTTGGVFASFALLGDINISEPNCLAGFAGKRVIENTIHEHISDDLQKSETLLKNGFIDAIVIRKDLRRFISKLIELHSKNGGI